MAGLLHAMATHRSTARGSASVQRRLGHVRAVLSGCPVAEVAEEVVVAADALASQVALGREDTSKLDPAILRALMRPGAQPPRRTCPDAHHGDCLRSQN